MKDSRIEARNIKCKPRAFCSDKNEKNSKAGIKLVLIEICLRDTETI